MLTAGGVAPAHALQPAAPPSTPTIHHGGGGDDATVIVDVTDASPGGQHPGGRVDQGEGNPTLFYCDIFYMGPDGSVWTPWDCDPEAPLVSEGVIYHGSSDLPPLIEAPFVQRMIREMQLSSPQIASTPQDPNTPGAVGLPVWFWADDPGPTTTGPNSVTATAGRFTVTATGTMTGLTIATGDGETIDCAGPGTPYPGSGIEPSPDCGHTYEQTSADQPGGVYHLDVQAHWTIAWDDNVGHHTEMPIRLEGTKELRIDDLQAVRSGSTAR